MSDSDRARATRDIDWQAEHDSLTTPDLLSLEFVVDYVRGYRLTT
jgi:hypothetical protein